MGNHSHGLPVEILKFTPDHSRELYEYAAVMKQPWIDKPGLRCIGSIYQRQYLQRSNVGGGNGRKNFLERLGFEYYDSYQMLNGGHCYYKVINEVSRDMLHYGMDQILRTEAIHTAYRKFANNLGPLYTEIRKIDQQLYDAGFELPWMDWIYNQSLIVSPRRFTHLVKYMTFTRI